MQQTVDKVEEAYRIVEVLSVFIKSAIVVHKNAWNIVHSDTLCFSDAVFLGSVQSDDGNCYFAFLFSRIEMGAVLEFLPNVVQNGL